MGRSHSPVSLGGALKCAYTAHWSRDGQQVNHISPELKGVSKNSGRALTIFMSYTQYASYTIKTLKKNIW